MSDVWQGPGWWLASDGKWYPADAEPGAVYEGDLNQQESGSSVTAEEPPDMPTRAPAVEASPTAPVEPETRAGGGGWQAIDPGVEEPAPLAENTSTDDGWTSAYEERQTVTEILGAAHTPTSDSLVETDVPETTASFFQSPDSPALAPDMAIPDAAIPDMAIPDAAIPDMAIPDMAIPDMAIPDAAIPDMAIPDAAIPDMTIPDVSIPAVTLPEVSLPEVSLHDTSIPDAAMPDVAMPEVTAPHVAMPETAIPDAAAPDVAMPEVTAPIQRDAAWRTPNETPIARTEVQPKQDAPAVVDLAVPQSGPAPTEETSKRRFPPALAGLLGLVLLAGIAVVIISLLSGGDDPSEVDSTGPTTTTAEVPVQDEVGPDEVSVFDLRAGDCIVGDIGSGQVTQVTRVDCEEEHQFEVYREVLIDSTITTFDETAISQYAEDTCRSSLESYVPPEDPRDLNFKFLQPTEDSWNQEEEPDRVVTCLLFDDDAPLIGRAN